MVNPILRAMLVNVGGATAPAVYSLNASQPAFICFFVSPQSKSLIKEKILPALTYQPEHYDWIETSSPQNLLECYKALVDELPRMLKKWSVDIHDLGVEYTAGTKPMSAAAVMATIEHCSRYFYVGAEDPSGRKDGLGVVLDGKEYVWFQANPWDVLAVDARKQIAMLFNHGRYADARDRAVQLSGVCDAQMRPVYLALADLIDGYAFWDRFDYKRAQEHISKSLRTLQPYLAGKNDPLHQTMGQVNSNLDFLRAIDSKTLDGSRRDFLDLVANATRRADKAKKYDDAVARLYSALEGLARSRLLFLHDIRTSNVLAEKIPQSLREEFVRRLTEPQEPGRIKIGLRDSYRLLEALGDELGSTFMKQQVDLDRVLFVRNQSRLAHGSQPVSEEVYRKLLDIVNAIGGISMQDLPAFPEMRL